MTATANKDKIVIVAGGQRIPVPAGTDNEVIRQQLISMGYADVANAEIKKGKDPEGRETVEFVKKAGTKGLTPLALVERLNRVPPAKQTKAVADMRLVNQLLDETLTFEEAVADDALFAALRELSDYEEPKGARLCSALDELSPVAATDPAAW